MGCGGRRNPDEIGRAQWQGLAKTLRIGERFVLDLVADTAQRALDVLPHWKKQFKDENGAQSILETVPTAIAKRARRVLASVLK
jgi:hypothetical protein